MTITLNAAPTAWASDTNFSSGPNTGTTTKVNPGVGRFAQGWVPGDTLPAQHLNFHLAAVTTALADIISKVSGKAVDGAAGGSYTLTSPLAFLGAQPVNFHTIGVDSTGIFTVPSGGKINVFSGGVIEFDTSEDLQIEDSADTFRLSLGAAVPYFSGGAPTWVPEIRGRGWRQADVITNYEVGFPVPLPTGDSIVSVTVGVNGGVGPGHSSLPTGTDRLRVLLIATDASGNSTVLASRYDQSASVPAYDGDHTIVLQSGSLDSGSLPIVTDSNHTYWVCVEGETGANAVASTTVVQSIFGACLARSYRSTVQPYS